MTEIKVYSHIDISPLKAEKVCQNCKYFHKLGVHLGNCINRKKYTEKLDDQTCNKLEVK